MNINEIYVRLNNNESFQFKEQYSIDFECPKCKTHLVKFFLLSGERNCECQQEYLYDDGDTINIPKKYFLRADAEMMFGTCEKCGNKIALIHTIVLNKDISNDNLTDDCFTVVNEDKLIGSFREATQYAVTINNIIVGIAVIYKDAIINTDGVLELKSNVKRNVALVSLECLSESERMNISDIGICNGHFENDSQWEVWQEASGIAEDLINSVSELL